MTENKKVKFPCGVNADYIKTYPCKGEPEPGECIECMKRKEDKPRTNQSNIDDVLCELKKFIEICDCKEFQDNLDIKEWCLDRKGYCSEELPREDGKCLTCLRKDWVKLPTIEQLLEIIGNRFATLKLLSDHWMASYWTGDDKYISTTKRVNGQSARIALATAAKQILTERIEYENNKKMA